MSGGLALGTDELGFLLVTDVRGAATLGLAVDGHLIVCCAARTSGALDFPPDEDALESLGVEICEQALEGGFLGMVPAAAAFAVAAEGAQLELGELGGEGGQVALAAHDACQGGHDHDGQQAGQGVVLAFFLPPVGHFPAEYDQFAKLRPGGLAAGDDRILDMLECGGKALRAQDGPSLGTEFAHPELLGSAMVGVVVLAAAPAALGLA